MNLKCPPVKELLLRMVKARGALVTLNRPRLGEVRMVGTPVRLSATPGSMRTASPALGQHTDQVLRDLLGLGSEEIAALSAAGTTDRCRGRPAGVGIRRLVRVAGDSGIARRDCQED